ncbi:MAG: hypothetical protein M1823_005595 [Watsoniomyces obsoletus]|nr:MAG: hypothetical protein M1823_005595 [Watsoniomyces obsoletus]
MASPNPLYPLEANISLDNKEQIDHLLDDYLLTGSFDDLHVSGSSRRAEVRRRVTRVLRSRVGMQQHLSPVNYSTLKYNFKHGIKPSGNPSLIPSFTKFPTYEKPLAIHDNDGNILVYRFRLPDTLIQTLTSSKNFLPPIKAKETVRGSFKHRHYAVWADSAPSPFLSSEFRAQLPGSQEWLDLNRPLFNRLSDDLRLIQPTMYVKFRSVIPHLPPGIKPLCGIWLGCAINSGLDDPVGSGTHQDKKDSTRGFNCVFPYGNYSGDDLVLWQLKSVVELRPGDFILFYGSFIAHNVTGIENGERSSVDMFSHANVFQWKKKVVTGKTGGGQNAERDGYGQFH